MPLPNEAFGPEEFAACTHVSRETLARLKLYAGMLADWNTRQNLVSRASLNDVWLRHFWDSSQLTQFVPQQARSLVDLGSGAGFPGLVLAELLRDREIQIVLYEATQKKREFLNAVIRRLNLSVEVRGDRIEAVTPQIFDVVVARALAPLDRLLDYAQRFWGKDTAGLFLKGQNLVSELTEAHKCWRMTLQKHPSRTSDTGVVLEIRGLSRVAPSGTDTRGT